MMRMDRPQTIDQALNCLGNEGAKGLAGGTNIMVDRKKGREHAMHLVSLDALEELRQITEDDSGVHIGAMVTFDALEMCPMLEGDRMNALRQAAALVGGPQIRRRGTLGGNLLSASPSADSVPALMVLDASLTLLSPKGERCEKVDGFITGVRATRLNQGELLTKVTIPHLPGKSCFYKVGTRNAMAISVVNEAMYLESEGEYICEIRIALGSVAPTVVRAYKTEQFLRELSHKEALCEAVISQAKQLLASEITPITDLRAEADYRRLVAQNVFEANLKTLIGGSDGR